MYDSAVRTGGRLRAVEKTAASDLASTVDHLTSELALLSVPVTAAWTATIAAMPAPSADLTVDAQPGCPSSDRLCGFAAGMNAMIDDDTGAFDTFAIAAVDSGTLTIVRAISTGQGDFTLTTVFNKK